MGGRLRHCSVLRRLGHRHRRWVVGTRNRVAPPRCREIGIQPISFVHLRDVLLGEKALVVQTVRIEEGEVVFKELNIRNALDFAILKAVDEGSGSD